MVQKYTAPVRVYKYPFELVMAAYERRFPTCHLIPVFVGSDKIYENISEDGAIHTVERRCVINVDAPYLLRKITGVDHVLFIQKNTLDRRKRVLKIEAWNESFSNHINIHELCYYKASKENDEWTTFEQQASLEVKSFWGFEHVVEKLAVKHYSQNVKKGEEIIEFHIAELAQEGIHYIPPFDDSLKSNNLTSSTAVDDDSLNGATLTNDAKECTRSKLGRTVSTEQCDKGKNGLIIKSDKPAGANGCFHSGSADKPDCLRANSLDADATGSRMLNNSNNSAARAVSDTNNGFKSYSLQSPS